MERLASTMDDEQFAAAFSPEGLARQATWYAEDGWLVSYTTSRIRAGKLNGLFAVSYYKPKGDVWERVRLDRCDTRKEAKQRALRFYYEHSPKKAARHGWTGDGYA
jgi:hypothetical protein